MSDDARAEARRRIAGAVTGWIGAAYLDAKDATDVADAVLADLKPEFEPVSEITQGHRIASGWCEGCGRDIYRDVGPDHVSDCPGMARVETRGRRLVLRGPVEPLGQPTNEGQPQSRLKGGRGSVDLATPPAALSSRVQLRNAATGGGPCDSCGRPFWTHVCLSCSPDAQTPGPGCLNCRRTGMDQTPCQPPATPAGQDAEPDRSQT